MTTGKSEASGCLPVRPASQADKGKRVYRSGLANPGLPDEHPIWDIVMANRDWLMPDDSLTSEWPSEAERGETSERKGKSDD